MNSEYLGDAFDHWKGSLISILLSKGLIRNVLVEPMITDAQPWDIADVETYKRLLSLGAGCTICHGGSTFSGNRESYFGGIPQHEDIFLDPDTGMGTDNATRKHVKVTEIERLIGQSHRLVMVYQHSNRGDFTERLSALRTTVTDMRSEIHCIVYQCGRVAMFFISRDKGRLDEIEKALREHLCGTAEWRVW